MIETACPPESMSRMLATIGAASERVTEDAPLAYVRLTVEQPVAPAAKPIQPVEFVVDVMSWPGARYRRLATCDVNGAGVRLLPQDGDPAMSKSLSDDEASDE
jgi:hypothetical protein